MTPKSLLQRVRKLEGNGRAKPQASPFSKMSVDELQCTLKDIQDARNYDPEKEPPPAGPPVLHSRPLKCLSTQVLIDEYKRVHALIHWTKEANA